MTRDGGLCCCSVGRPHTGLITLPARLRGLSEAVGKMCPGAICLQPLDQMACKDSWGAEWGGTTFTKHPASPGASYSPMYELGIAIVIVQTRYTRPSMAVTSEGHTARKWGWDLNPGLPDFLRSCSIYQTMRFSPCSS